METCALDKNLRKQRERTNFLYVIEAALEYFITMLFTGAYLATLTKELGVSDALTGILSSVVALAQSFQLVALFMAHHGKVKRRTVFLQTLSQIAFALVYFVPIFQGAPELKIVLFMTLLLLAYALHNIVYPAKTNWFMSQVEDKKRGSFTATKEIVSLLGGMVFSFVISFFIDELKATGDVRGAFLLGGIAITVLTVLHALTLILSHEEDETTAKRQAVSSRQMLKGMVKDKKMRLVILLPVCWSIAHFVATPFNGSYTIKELGFSLTFMSILSAIGSVSRAVCSRPIGKYADKTSFTTALNLCFSIAAVGFLIHAFTAPTTNWLYPVGSVLYCIAMAGINSGEINLIYDFVEPERRVGALALKNFLAGTAGFLTTLAMSPLIEYVQASGNTFLGLPLYAQQVANAFAFLLTIGTIVYLNVVVRKLEKTK